MMDDIRTLNEMLSQDVVEEIKTDRNGVIGTVLKESSKYSLRLQGLPEDVLVFKTDRFPTPKGFFRNCCGEAKRADYTLVARDDGGTGWIVHIEMKRDNSFTEGEVIKQLRGGACVLSYCREVGKQFWTRPNFLNDFNHRFVSIRIASINKRKSRTRRRKGAHNSPEKMLKLVTNKGVLFTTLTRPK